MDEEECACPAHEVRRHVLLSQCHLFLFHFILWIFVPQQKPFFCFIGTEPPTDGERLQDFYHTCTNSILQQLEIKLWKIADALFRISSMTNSFQSSPPWGVLPLQFSTGPSNFLSFQKLWVVRHRGWKELRGIHKYRRRRGTRRKGERFENVMGWVCDLESIVAASMFNKF